MKKCAFIAVLLGLFLNFNIWASMITFYIIETGLPESSNINQYSSDWEDAFLDVFFDAGYIVSNAPIFRMSTIPAGNILQSVDINVAEARNWGIDYIFITFLDYSSGMYYPEEIKFYIYNSATNENILERQIQGRVTGTARDESGNIRAFIRGLIPYIR